MESKILFEEELIKYANDEILSFYDKNINIFEYNYRNKDKFEKKLLDILINNDDKNNIFNLLKLYDNCYEFEISSLSYLLKIYKYKNIRKKLNINDMLKLCNILLNDYERTSFDFGYRIESFCESIDYEYYFNKLNKKDKKILKFILHRTFNSYYGIYYFITFLINYNKIYEYGLNQLYFIEKYFSNLTEYQIYIISETLKKIDNTYEYEYLRNILLFGKK